MAKNNDEQLAMTRLDRKLFNELRVLAVKSMPKKSPTEITNTIVKLGLREYKKNLKK